MSFLILEKSMDIIDLHSDLLLFLSSEKNRSPTDPRSRCSLPQLEAGGVKKQVLAIYAETSPRSVESGKRQIEWFLELEKEGKFIPAFENASTFAHEEEPLDQVFDRLEKILRQLTPLYLSLTWNGENRFGGGCGSDVGLKADGKELLHFLSGKRICLDFSHTCDRLAHDLFEEMEKNSLSIPVMASHSNFRSIHNEKRNLPDLIAKEIISREGLIGLVFYSKFLKCPEQLLNHIQMGLELGGEKALAFGADFFCTTDLPVEHPFFDEMSDSSKYPSVLKMLENQGIQEDLLKAIAHDNAQRFIQNNVCSLQ
jgi:membrane dipeptidase